MVVIAELLRLLETIFTHQHLSGSILAVCLDVNVFEVEPLFVEEQPHRTAEAAPACAVDRIPARCWAACLIKG